MQKQPDIAQAVSTKADSDLATDHNSKSSHDSTCHCLVVIFAALLFLYFASTLISNAPLEPVEEIEQDLLARAYINAIPKCISSCIVPRVLKVGCAHTDHVCLCNRFHLLDDSCTARHEKQTLQQCIEECGYLDQWRAPGLIIDSCAAVGVAVTIPQFMQNMFRIHGRQFESVTLGSTLGSAVGATVVPASVTLTAIRSSVSSSTTHTLLNTESSSTGGSSTTASNTARPVTPSTPSSTTTSNTAGPTITSTSSSGPSPGSSSLSSGAKIGIGVTVPIVLILLIVGIFIFFRRRKRSVSAENGQENDDGGLPEAVATITELKDNSYPPNYPTNRAEAGGNQIHEMNDNDSHKYSQGMRVPPIHELNSDTDNSRNDLTSADTSHIEGIKSPQSNAAAMGKKSVFTPPPKPTFPAPWENSPEMVYPAPNLGPGPGPQDGDEDLKKMQEEMAVIRERKERLRSLQALEEREEELKRRIQEREKTGGPAS